MKKSNVFGQVQETIDKVLKTRRAVRENLLQGLSGERLNVAKVNMHSYGVDKVRSMYDGKTVTEKEEMERDFYDCFDMYRMGNCVGAFYGEQVLNVKEIKECAKVFGSLWMFNLLSPILREQETFVELKESFIANIFSFDEIASSSYDMRKTLWKECEHEIKICLNCASKETVEKFLDIFTEKGKKYVKEDLKFLKNPSAQEVESAKEHIFHVARRLLPNAPQNESGENSYRLARLDD